MLRAKHVAKKKPIPFQKQRTGGRQDHDGLDATGSGHNDNGHNTDEIIKGSFTSLLFPGTIPEVYHEGDYLPIFVELVESRKTQLPVKFFQIPGVCRAPSKEEIQQAELDNVKIKRNNLGQKLMSSQSTQLTPYFIKALKDQFCTSLCQSHLNSKNVKFLKRLIDKQYRVHFTLDSLPVLVRSKSRNYALRGFPIGFKQQNELSLEEERGGGRETTNGRQGLKVMDGASQQNYYYVYNHLRFVIYYRYQDMDTREEEGEATQESEKKEQGIHITGFDVVPVSIQHDMQQCGLAKSALQNKKDTFQALPNENSGTSADVLYSYEVTYQQSDIAWADRWDIYMMEMPDSEIHYFAIVNSLMIAFLLTGAVAVIMIRALKKDIAKYNSSDVNIRSGIADDDEHIHIMEESGWKLLHGDVFRPPMRGRILLSVCMGTGLQIGTSAFLTLLASSLRLLNPMRKGQTLSYIVMLYVLSGSVAGYGSARLYKFFNGKAWKRATLLTATAFPGVLFTLFVALNFFLHLALGKASAAVSFWTMLLMFVLWVCVSAPLVYVGAFFGYKAPKIDVPTKSTQIARFVPESSSWFVRFPHCSLLAGILPFTSVCIELSFIMNALWINQIYYIMGFLTVVCFVFTLSCSTISIVMCYCQLCNEDHKWWWKSFFQWRLYRILSISLFFMVPGYKVGTCWFPVICCVHFIHGFDLFCFRPLLWQCRIVFLLLVLSKDIRCCESRLIRNSHATLYH
jgi:Endomembrane protein 70.